MPAEIYDIEDFEQGTTFQWDITIYDVDGVTPLDITGMTVRSQMRKRYSDAVAAEEFTVTYPDPVNGQVRLTMSASETAALTTGRYVYDIELSDASSNVIKIYKGHILVTPEATKAA